MATTTLTSKGQMTLPKSVRDELKIGPGDKIDIVKKDGEYVLKPRTARFADLVRVLGIPPVARALTVEETDDAIEDALAEDDERIRAGR